MQTVFIILCFLFGAFVAQATSICDSTSNINLGPSNAQQFENCTYFQGYLNIGYPIFLSNYGTDELRYLSKMTSIYNLALFQKLNLTALNNVSSLPYMSLEFFFEPVGPDFFPKLNSTNIYVETNGTDFSYLRNIKFITGLTIASQIDVSYFTHMRLLAGTYINSVLGFGAVNYTTAQLAQLVQLGSPHTFELTGYLGTSFNVSMFYPTGNCPGYGGLTGVEMEVDNCPNLVDLWFNCPIIGRIDITGPMDHFFPEGLHFPQPVFFDNMFVTSMKWTNMYALNASAGVGFMDLELSSMLQLTSFGITQTYWNDLTIGDAPLLSALPELSSTTFFDSDLNLINVAITTLDLSAATYISRLEIENMPNLQLINAPILSHIDQLNLLSNPLLNNLTMCQLCQFSTDFGAPSATMQSVPQLSCSGLSTLYQQWIGSAPTSQVSGCDNANAKTYCVCQIPSSSSTRPFSSSSLHPSSSSHPLFSSSVVSTASSIVKSSSAVSTASSVVSTSSSVISTAGGGGDGSESSTADNNDGSSDDTNKKIAALVILIVVILVVIGIIAGCVIWCRRRGKHNHDTSNMTKMDDLATHTDTL